jgi:serine/threonine-protein kinase
MDAERWGQVGRLFHDALERPAAERAEFVARSAQADPALNELVGALLEAHARTGGLETGGALEPWPAESSTLDPGARVGPYEILCELGRGGMGTVHLARRKDGGFDQRVAVKLLKRGMDSDAILRRFAMERQILARLAHPHIARLHDGGSTGDGRPYFVMEYIDGRPLPAYAAEQALDLEARLRLFLKLCAAVQFAHQNLVVHSDVKPANVLVDREGQPKLLDFGIAKLLRAPQEGATTALGARPLTPDYASPEQLAGEAITTATDVYALGLLLFELLTGRNPQAEGRRAGELGRASQWLAGPTPPGLPPDERRLARALRGDLEAILGRALEHDPRRRYRSAADLADDVQRHLERRPVAARPQSAAYRLGRFVRRHKLAVATVLALGATLGAAAWQTRAVADARQRAEAQRERARTLALFLVDVFAVSDPSRSRGATVTAREVLDAAAQRLSGQAPDSRWFRASAGGLEADPATRAELLHAVGEVYANLGLLEPAQDAFERTLALRGTLAGREADLDTAATLTRLAHLCRTRGDHARAGELYERGLALRERRLGTSAAPVGESLNGLGLLRRAQGRPAEARALLERAVAILREGGREARPALADALANLGALLTEEQRPDAAQRSFDEARALAPPGGLDDPARAVELANLAGLLYARGDYAGAEARFRDVVEIRRRVLGARHPDLALALSNLSAAEYERGRLEAAAGSAREALAVYRRHFEHPHADVAAAVGNLASIVHEQGRLEEAQALYGEALALDTAVSGARSAAVATDLQHLALVAADRGDANEAERLAREALALRRQVLGSDHLDVATSLNALAGVVQRAGRLAEAEALYRQALALRQRLLPPDHPALAESLVGLGSVLLRRGQARQACPLLDEALGLRRAAFPPDHLLVARAENTLGACLAAVGELARAGELLRHSHAVLLARRGAGHADVRLSAERLAELESRTAAGAGARER